jgi:hypothetical protein
MTSRINAAHTTCPGCQEEVYLDELVKGRCPLCGCTLEELDEHEHDLDEFIDRSDLPWLVFNYFLFKRFLEMGASPIQVMLLANGYSDRDDPANGQKTDTRFILEVPRGFVDRVRPKQCARCRRLYFSGGKKVVSGDLATPDFAFQYICSRC